jgi:GTP cyclohydrolase-4
MIHLEKTPMSHPVYLSVGANHGDRQATILQALQYLQTRATIKKLSSFHNTDRDSESKSPGANFLNVVCEVLTDLTPKDLLRFIGWIQERMGQHRVNANIQLAVDIDILLYDGLAEGNTPPETPHSELEKRACFLVPLAEIAPKAVHTITGVTIASLAKKVDSAKVNQIDRALRFRPANDIQQSSPTVHVSLSRVGVTNLKRIIQIADGGRGILFYAELNLFVDLHPDQAGVHMSRFSDELERLVEKISIGPSQNIETLAAKLAQEVVRTQGAIYSEVHIRAKSPMMKATPISGKPVEELYTLIGIAASTLNQTKHLVGIEVEGMTVCPCAQDMMRSYSKDLLIKEGFPKADAERIVSIVPMASHNQRGRGTLLIGSVQPVRAENLVHIVEASMSSETYELLKRPDEFFIVNKAHRSPRFVEDVVREILRNVIHVYPDMPDDTFIMAKQENFESIHQHNAFAERFGTLGEIRNEILMGDYIVRHTPLEDWLKE